MEENTNSSKSLESIDYKLIDIKEEYFKKYDQMQNRLYYKLKEDWWRDKNIYDSSMSTYLKRI